jgi:hypothetical protein
VETSSKRTSSPPRSMESSRAPLATTPSSARTLAGCVTKSANFTAEAPDEPIQISLPNVAYTPVFELATSAPTSEAISVSRHPGPALRLWMSPYWRSASLQCRFAWRALRTPAPPPQGIALTQYPCGEFEPSVSPDGNDVAFAWTGPISPGPQDNWIKEIDSDSRRQLTNAEELCRRTALHGRRMGRRSRLRASLIPGQAIANQGVFVAQAAGEPS